MLFSAPHFNPIFFSQESLFFGLSSTTWTAIGSIGVILTVISALFGGKIGAILFNPKLKFGIARRCLQSRFENGLGVYRLGTEKLYQMYRIVVKNIGESPASNVRALIEVINGKNLILPIPLTWTHINGFTRDISVGDGSLRMHCRDFTGANTNRRRRKPVRKDHNS